MSKSSDKIPELCAAVEQLVTHLRNLAGDDEIAAALQTAAVQTMLAAHPPRTVAAHLFAGGLAVIADALPRRHLDERIGALAAAAFETALAGLKMRGVSEQRAVAEGLSLLLIAHERINGGVCTTDSLRNLLAIYERDRATIN